MNCGLTFDTVKNIALCDILSLGLTLLVRRVILPFWILGIYLIDLLEIEMTVTESKDKICKEGTNNG